MADELGTAVLRLELDTSGLKEALAKAKQQVEQELGTATAGATTGTSRTRRTPPSTRVTAKGGARESTDAVERANQRIIGLQNRINVLEAKGVDISQARARLSQAITANSQRNFGTVRQVTSQLSNTLKIEEGRLRVSELKTAQLKRQAAAEKAATGTATQKAQKPTGVGFATTPEQILASRGGTQKGAAESLSAREAAGDKLIQLRNRLNILEAKGVDISTQRATLERALTAANSEQLGTAKQITQSLSRQISIDENNLRVANLRAAAEKRRLADLKAAERKTQTRTTTVGTTTTTPTTPGASTAATRAALTEEKLTKARTNAARATERATLAEKKQRAQDIQGRISSGLIGGAFPLMFGQGGGASIGGLLGGVAGGGPFGFGASLIGTLVGSQIDLLNQRFGDLAKALEDPLANFDAFIEKATLASKAQESLVKALQETGQTTAAAELIRTEASRTIDPIQAQGAVIAQDQFNRALSDTQDVLGAIVSGPATGFLTFLAGVVKTTKEAAAKDPIEASLKTQEKAANSIGRNIGGILSGTLLAAGGISSLFATGGVSAPVAVPLIGSGLSIAAIGAAGATSDNADLAAAQSSEVLAFQLALVEAKQRQIRIEKEILTATSQGKENLTQQLSVQLQFNALKIQEQQELSKIQQELERNLATPLGNDAEDRAKAIEQEKQLRLAIELRRDALLAAATAGQTQSIKGLSAAKELQGAYGDQRTILEEQLKLKEAALKADEAQAQLNKLRRTPGADPKEVQAAKANVNAAINTIEIANIEGLDKIQRAQDNIALGAFKEFQAREQISSSIENTLQLLGTEQGQYRDTLGTIQQISATLDAARRKEAEIGFQIDQARVGGRDEEASRLVDQQRTAALETRKLLTESAFELTKAGESLKEASIVARDNLRGAVLEFTRTRSDEQGLNRFLSPQQQQNRAEQDLKLLLPSFREAQSRFTGLTGAKAPEFRGPTADLNAAVRDFITAVDRESQAGRDLGKARENLEQTNKALVEVNMELTKATAALAAKEWLVSVNVVNNANGSSTVDAVNGLTS